MREAGIFLYQDLSWFQIPLPIGISFFTFQLLSYLFDVYYRKSHAQRNVLNLGLYISFFPQLIAGPIVRYDVIENQIQHRKEHLYGFSEGMIRFIYGLAKKVLIANYIAQIADNIFDAGVPLSVGTWFRDYVYIPLGGNRVPVRRWVFNLFVVWALTGLWHGANWTFLCWGLYYFIILLLEKKLNPQNFLGEFSHVYTLFIVVIGWVIFRSDSIADGISFVGMMFGFGCNSIIDDVFLEMVYAGRSILLLGVLLSMPVFPWLGKRFESRGWSVFESLFALGLFLLSLLIVVSSSYNPFIYFNF